MKYIGIVLGIVIFILLGIGLVDLIVTYPDECNYNEVFTDLHYGSGGYECISQEVHQSIVYSKCMGKLKSFNNSMSNTWGNDEYNTIPVVAFAERFLKECEQKLLVSYKI